MASFIISAKFLGSQVEFAIQNLDQYTLGSLWADVYMYTCATFPEPTETFKAEVKLPWSGEYKVLNDDRDLQCVFNMFKNRNLKTIKIDVELQAFAVPAMPPKEIDANNLAFSSSESHNNSIERVRQSTVEVVDLSTDDDGNNGEQLPSYASLPSEDDEDYVPNSNSSMSKTSSDILPADVQSDSDTESDDEQLSNAASFTWNNDFMEQESSDDEDGGVQRPSQGPRGRPYRQFAGGRVHLEVGQLFNNLNHFRLVLRDYVVQEGFELKRIKNAKERYTAECVYEGCSWRIHASPVDDRTGFMIKTMNDRHCCQKVHKNQEANATWVAHRFRAMIEENPEITVKLLGREIQRIYGLSIPTYTLYRAKNRVLNKAEKEHVTSYNSLYSYGYSVKQRNPGSMVLLKTVTPHLGAPTRFQRFFLSFQAQKDGLLYGCRPFLGLDGCHLKGNYPGVLLSAIGIDANNGVFPVAVCICEGENKDSWGWFIQQLYMHIGLEESRRITFMTDRQKGVLDAIERFWPRSSNRYCVRHVIANLQSRFKGQLSGMYVWNAANSSNKNAFMEEMAKLKEVNERAHDWIMQIPLKHWCVHAFDTHVKSEHTTNNITESFNSWVDKYRGYPALMLLESLRRKMMKRMYKRLEDARKWSSNLPPLVAKKLAERQDEGRFVIVLCASDTEYEVKEESKYFIVNLITRSCDCGLWEVSGIPCKHAMAVITAKRLNAEDYIDAYLTKAAYLRTYSYVIHPIPSQSQWPEVQHPEVLPPEKKRLPGRPKKNRKRGPEEPPKQKRSGQGKCTQCGEYGHNIRTCKGREGAASKKRKGENSTIGGKRKMNFEVGSSSRTATRARVDVRQTSGNVGPTAGTRFGTATSARVELDQTNKEACNHYSASKHATQTVGVASSQSMTCNAPLYSSQNASQPFTSSANPGTVAGLNIDWSIL